MFREALDAGKPFDCAVLDIVLPGMDGLQTLEKMRAEEQERAIPPDLSLKVIMASALSDQARVNRAFFQGQAVSYLTKPFSIDQIRSELDKFGL
jgi:two-component system chemotaxis response regulator CheY